MSIHISSHNVSTTTGNGEIYDGTWILNNTVKGEYEVVDQTIDWTTIPWFTSDTNRVEYQNEEFSPVFLLFANPTDVSTYQYSTDLTAIALYIQNRWNYVGSLGGFGPNFTCVVTVNTNTQNFELQFSKTIGINYNTSTISSVYNTGYVFQQGTLFLWSYINIDIHPHLFLKVAEMSNNISEKDMQNVSMIFHTQDNPLIGMRVSIPVPVNKLTIKIYRASQPNDVIVITSPWEFVLKYISG